MSAETLAQFRQMMTEATVREIYAALVTDLNKRLTGLEDGHFHGAIRTKCDASVTRSRAAAAWPVP